MNMVKVNTAELEGAALDWAVAQIEGVKTMMLPKERGSSEKKPFALFGSMAFELGGAAPEYSYSPSTCWHCGGPLIEKHMVGVDLERQGLWVATPINWTAETVQYATTPLIAACRAIVASKLGDTVQVPAELIGGAA